MPVDIADEVKAQPPVAKDLQRAHRHRRPEVAAADADVDDVGEVAGLGACTHLFGKGEQCIEHAMHLGIEGCGGTPWCAQRRVQHGTALGRVGNVAAQHRIAPRLEPALTREFVQEAQAREVDAVLGQIGEDLGRLERERSKALRVARKGLAQVEAAAMGFEVTLQCHPGLRAVAARPGRWLGRGHPAAHLRKSSIRRSSLAASAAKARMPSASFSVAMASSLRAQRKAVSS